MKKEIRCPSWRVKKVFRAIYLVRKKRFIIVSNTRNFVEFLVWKNDYSKAKTVIYDKRKEIWICDPSCDAYSVWNQECYHIMACKLILKELK